MNVKITYDGLSLKEIARTQGINLSTIQARHRLGWSKERILEGIKPTRYKFGDMTLSELAKKLGISYSTAISRHKEYGWTEEEMIAGKRSRGYKLKHNGRTATLKEWADETGIPLSTLRNRLRNYYDTKDILK